MINKNKFSEIYFKEEQRFRQVWLWAIVLLTCAIPWVGMIIQIILGQKVGNNPAPDVLIILIWLVFGVGFPVFFYSLKLITEVRKDGIHFRFFPFHRKFKIYSYDEIDSYSVREYKPIREFGGWGIRYGLGGKAYNVYGNNGIQLILKNKKKLLIGTQKPEELYRAISNTFPGEKNYS
ncbi:MAG: DUF6141 family protein [Ignavibacteria bacterium]|nr:DUF6141 family protein [Ignavibacteria bacterium]